MKRAITAAIAIAVLGAMVGYVASQRDLVDTLRTVSPGYVLSLLVLGVLTLVAQARQYLAALRAYEVRLPIAEATGLTAVNTMANYYVPARGGSVVRGSYMYAVHGFGIASYAIVAISIVTAGLVVAGAVGFACSVALGFSRPGLSWRLPAAFVGVVVLIGIAAGMAVFTGRLLAWSNRFSHGMSRLSEATSVMIGHRSSMSRLLGWSVVVLVLQTWRLMVAFQSIGVDLSVPQIGLIGSLVGISFVLSLTPGNLGIKEGVTAAAAALVGIEAETALVAALVDRGAALVVTFAAGLFALPFLMRKVASGRSDTQDAPDRDSIG